MSHGAVTGAPAAARPDDATFLPTFRTAPAFGGSGLVAIRRRKSHLIHFFSHCKKRKHIRMMQTAASDVWSLSHAEQLVNTVPLTPLCAVPPPPPPRRALPVRTWLGPLIHTPGIILFLLPPRSCIIDMGRRFAPGCNLSHWRCLFMSGVHVLK